MELIRIEGAFTMDCGAPMPIILSGDNELIVAFFSLNEDLAAPDEHVVIKFKRCIKYIFGTPGNETLHGHPYYKLGLRSCSFYQLKGSDLIQETDRIESVHPAYKPGVPGNQKHYILTFHDNMFECIAAGYEVLTKNEDYYNQALTLLEMTANSRQK
ncbi:hypothetical protein [Chitinophaga sp. Cy-1792]|uniref:hypothetical protein n=1 Tax=Chitinophaga sp. Cy-1792 TaxID=2608339 RepID=UPI00141E3043|nr:hypothetical protein [Chitinophaga sp. Cy-1792]NIG55010.1 hypothetical protein [Chitinophaga sp. Cy-1792]